MEPETVVNGANTAWVLISAALVLLMTPGLAFFYGGMSRSKSVLNMLMMSFTALGIVSVLWVLYGYAVAFGSSRGGLIGWSSGLVGLDDLVRNVTVDSAEGGVVNTFGLPDLAFSGFQMMFAIITVALISGAVADRMKFGAWVAFTVLWATVVYFPVAHWVFAFGVAEDGGAGAGASGGLFAADSGGWIVNRLGALDFAGGTAVHINAGAAALALVLVLGKRKGFGREPMRPHNLPLVMLGAGLLWFGWFGFNAGSALGANGLAGLAFVNTQVATAAALLAWIGTERLRDGHATTLGAASGAVAGLVAITPACGAVNPLGAIVIGLVAGGACCLAVTFKHRLGLRRRARRRRRAPRRRPRRHADDRPRRATRSSPPATRASSTAAASRCSASRRWRRSPSWRTPSSSPTVIALLVKAAMGLRVSEEEEVTGIDQTVHAETAYELGGGLGGAGGGTLPAQAGLATSTRVPS